MDRRLIGTVGSLAPSILGLGTGKNHLRGLVQVKWHSAPKELERRILQLTNEARRKNGLPPLYSDNDLAVKAGQKVTTCS